MAFRTLSPLAFVAAAQMMVGLGEDDQHRPSRLIDEMLAEVAVPADAPWPTAFVHCVGWRSHREPGGAFSSWPFPRPATPDALAAQARKASLTRDVPDAGDIVLIRSRETRDFVQIGILTSVDLIEIHDGEPMRFHGTTIEGTMSAGRTGRWVVERSRLLCPEEGDLSIGWELLDRRPANGNPTAADAKPARVKATRAKPAASVG